MKKLILSLLASLLCLCNTPLKAHKIGLCIMATGKYTQFIGPLLDSARIYFCPGHDVTFFIFTDGTIPQSPDVVRIDHTWKEWPYGTLMRCAAYYNAAEYFAGMDYLFATDADMLFVDTVGNEICAKTIATLHPGYYRYNKSGTPETNPASAAYIEPFLRTRYFAGGFVGGEREAFLALCKAMYDGIKTDLNNNFIAIWHDESHLNRYFAYNPPARVLSPSYCFPPRQEMAQRWGIDHFEPRLIALDKNHVELRKGTNNEK